MNRKIFIQLIICFSLIIVGCKKDDTLSKPSTDGEELSSSSRSKKITKITGLGFYAETTECDYPSKGANYAVRMTGDLEGCLYVFVDKYNCWGKGFYFETGTELFVGTYKGKPGTFRTTYKFEAKFEGCNEDGTPRGAEIFGLCQHPIVNGSGEGVFAGVSGRLDFWDNVKAVPINFPYIGHLKF